MKRSIFACVALLIVASACQKEEVFNPRRRITSISTQTNTDIQLTSTYVYNGKLLAGMTLYPVDNSEKTYYTFEYNKDKTMSKIYNTATGEHAELTYHKALLQQIDVYNSQNRIVSYIRLSHKEKKINRITYYSSNAGINAKADMSAVIFPGGYELMRKACTRKDNMPQYMKQYITYNGDNVSRVRTYMYDVSGDSVLWCSGSYTYDELHNPFYGLPLPIMDMQGYSKNNVVMEYEVYENGYSGGYDRAYVSRSHSYVSEKSFPIKHSMTENSTLSDVKSVYDDRTGTYKDTVIVRRSGVSDMQYYLYEYAR